MPDTLKFIFFALILGILLLAGYYIYRYLNNKIKSSETGWQLLAYALLLLGACAGLFFAGVFTLIYGYKYLAMPE